MTKGIGINKDQIRVLGIEFPLKSGWRDTIIGKEITEEQAKEFLALKGMTKGQRRTRQTETEEADPRKKIARCLNLAREYRALAKRYLNLEAEMTERACEAAEAILKGDAR